MGAEAVVEEPKPVPKPVPERPSVSESEKREYRNGYFRRTYTNVRSKSTKAKFAELVSFILLTCVFIPLVIAVTLYTYMFIVYNQDHQKHVNVDWVQRHVADRLERTYINNIYGFAAEHLDINNRVVRFLSPLRYEVQAMMRIKTIEQAYIVATATIIGIWFAAMPVFLFAFYIIWTSFKMGLTYLLPKGSTPVYILDFATLKTDQALRVSYPMFERKSRSIPNFTNDSIEFQNKILKNSCISDSTTFPPGVHYEPPRVTMEYAREEAKYVFKRTVGDCLKMCNLKPKDIDLLIVNCSLFCPTPSLSAMIINMFGMREDIKNYNLGGMGCSAGLVSIDLARDLLQVYPNSNCLVVSTENITQNWYHGNEKSCLMSNTLFRMGGAAILLTNKQSVKSRAKYELVTTTRVMRAADQTSYDCVFQKQDGQMYTGVQLSIDLIACATKAVSKNMTKMLLKNPFLMPLSEIAKFVLAELRRKIAGGKPHVPNFSKIFDHLCIHAGGRKVLDDLGKELQLGDKIKPSRAALFCFGNTSSATTWYELEFVENSGKLKKGDKILQMAFGSGFKCNSVVWRSLQTLDY